MSGTTEFRGFYPETYSFFEGLEKDNSKKYFDRNRDVYDNYVVAPAKAFINAVAPFLNQLNPAIRTAPKFNETIMRLNKDMRFARGVPYRTFMLIHFGRFKMDSEMYLYIDKSGLTLGLFLNKSAEKDLFLSENLSRYEKDFKETFARSGLNDKYGFYEFQKEPVQLVKKFNINRHFNLITKSRFMLFERAFPKTKKICYGDSIVVEAIKAFSSFYHLYCFAISPTPLKLIHDFEDRLGIPE